MYTSREIKCPRCEVLFECNAGNISQCQCSRITLRFEERQYISEQFTGCLCSACINELRIAFGTVTLQPEN